MKPNPTQKHIADTRKALYELEKELRFFRDGTPETRELFRNSFDWPDTGYVLTLLKALGKEESFQNWLMMTTHHVA